MTTFRTVLEPTGGNNVGILVAEDVLLAFNRGKRVPSSSPSTAATTTRRPPE